MKKLRASSMYYALFLSIVIAILLGGMVLFSGLNRQLALQFTIEEILMDNAASGIEYGLVAFKELPDGQPVHLRLFGEGVDSVTVTKKQWGAFTVIQSTATHRNRSVTRMVLAGNRSDGNEPNLYVADQGRPIALCGDTRIEGSVRLPKAGLKRAYIEGKNYTGEKMIYGTQAVSEKNMPPVNESFIMALGSCPAGIRSWDPEADSIRVSFQDNAVHFISDGPVSLQNLSVSGQVMIESADSICVSASANLNHVILRAPVVYFAPGFKGTVQVFASRRIELDENVVLLYPSVLGLIEQEFPTVECASVTLQPFSQVIGSVFLLSRDQNFRLPVQLNVSSGSAIDGFVYCQGKTQLSGIINGHLYTDKFYLKTRASTYENHLLDAQVLDRLPSGFVSVNLLEEVQHLTRIEWLN